LQESTEEGGDQDPVILPGGDPDAGMPADQAEIHGIERGPPAEDHDQEPYPVTTDSLDNIDEGVPVVKETSGGNVTHPPPNSD